MAVVPLVPATINIAHRRGAYQQYKSSAVLDFAGAAIDLSAWASMAVKLVAQSPGPNTADVTAGTATGSAAGIITVTIASTDLATIPAGTAQVVITGVHVGGDNPQLLASGSFQLAES